MNSPRNKPLSLIWLRRDLRLHDHAAFAAALAEGGEILPVFVFDTEVLERFSNKSDQRLAFIADALCDMQRVLAQQGSGILVLYGEAQTVIPQLAKALDAKMVFCGEDYEPETRKRDDAVKTALEREGRAFTALCDHLIFRPDAVRKKDGKPYLVFTPYSKAWRVALNSSCLDEKKVVLEKGDFTDVKDALRCAEKAGFQTESAEAGAQAMLKKAGYVYNPSKDWKTADAQKRLKQFISKRIGDYNVQRDFMAVPGTSGISPYLRFGLVSIRECMRLAVEQLQHETWVNELIWREFYAMILYHFPESVGLELVEKYRGLPWLRSGKAWESFSEARTGYPLIDAAMRQLHETGWMHNRARMIVASFLCKDMHLDWRLGEEHFAQWLMDYELASNVGGWQWASSTGTDAVPFFRVFNPVTQSKRFDLKGEYIRRWLPEFKNVPDKEVHMPSAAHRPKNYPAPVLDHDEERKVAIGMYKNFRSVGL